MSTVESLIERVEIFPWSDNFCTGIDVIDEQHRTLVDLLNKLAARMAYGSDEQALQSVFNELTAYANYHFETEEGVWQHHLAGHELATEHARMHRDFVTQVAWLRAQEGLLKGAEAVQQVVSFLTHWLAFHILEEDLFLARVVLSLEQGQDVAQACTAARTYMKGAVHVLVSAILNMYDGLSVRTLALMREISERRRAEDRLRLASKVIESSADAIFIARSGGQIDDANPTFCLNAGQTRLHLLGQPVETVMPGLFASERGRQAWRQARDQGRWAGELGSRRPDGSIETVWLTLSTLRDEALGTQHVVGVISSISQLVQRHHELELAANHDALTGLPNRRLLTDRLQQAVQRSKRTGKLLAVAMLDLDCFKPVNDASGHDVGDLVLQAIAQRMKQALRGADTVARLGGDEFVLLLGELEKPQEVVSMLERLLHDVAQPIEAGSHTLQVSASLGCVMYPKDADDAQDLLKCADIAMYVAKAQGKGCLRFYNRTLAD